MDRAKQQKEIILEKGKRGKESGKERADNF